jgi:Immunity protein 53
MSAALDFLVAWYRAHCDGHWEHAYGVTIETLDAPGWMVTIDLSETPLEGHAMTPLRRQDSENDWLLCTVEQNRFCGQGDTAKMDAILEVFRLWAISVSDSTQAPQRL